MLEYVEEIAPLIYTPTVGDACTRFGYDFRRSRGMFFSRDDRGNFGAMCWNWPQNDVKVIVVTDGSRILGLGDLGVHGLPISIGKLALYVAAGGIAPSNVLPVVLDVGTDNAELREDPDYVGIPLPRLDGADYFDFIDEFMQAVYQRWPQVVVQFEDFQTSKAVPLLEKYRNKYRCFNDDIQGTGCVTLAGCLSAARNAGSSLKDMRVVCAGAGSAGLGVCQQLVDGMVAAGLDRDEAMARFVICTSRGALGKADGSRGDPNHERGLNSDRQRWVNPVVSDGTTMLDVIHEFKPTCLLGLAAQPTGIFTKEIIEAMALHCDRPVIMPMSNPTSKAECTPAQAYEWTDGKAVVATGTGFPEFQWKGKTFVPSQCNNMYVFPGLGLAAAVAGTKHITDRMLYKAAVACMDAMTPDEIQQGRTFPNITRIRDVSLAVACAVIEEGFEAGLNANLDRDDVPDHASLRAYVASKMWVPDYAPLVVPMDHP